MKSNYSFVKRNSLSIVLLICFALSFVGQLVTGWHEYNKERVENGQLAISFESYFATGHIVQATFENWESEFLQMGMYVVLTVWLRQQGSSESKKMEGKEEVDREPDPSRKGAPWPVKRGGWILSLYKNSLSLAFILLFLFSFMLHAVGSHDKFNEEQNWKHQPDISMAEFLGQSRFWFESFQNWQSEFVAVISIVVLSIYLRQQGSPESKPVDASIEETGD